jgi:hypothetical protein
MSLRKANIRHSLYLGGLENLAEDSPRTMDGGNQEITVLGPGGFAGAKVAVLCYLPRGDKTYGTNRNCHNSACD